MPSPFPGMNPYLEQPDAWHDFHFSAIPLMRAWLTPQVRPKYIAKVETTLYIRETPDDERRLIGRADLTVSTRHDSPADESATTTIVAPAHARLPQVIDEEKHSYIEILDRETRDLITVIELLSPTNKQPGQHREQYLAMRREILDSPAHLVEIDLLRGGPRMPLEESPECDYVVLVSRASARPDVDLWPIALDERLPLIPIPLGDGDGDATLDLQDVLHHVYDAAGYGDYIYNNPPQPRLSEEQQRWADEIVASTRV